MAMLKLLLLSAFFLPVITKPTEPCKGPNCPHGSNHEEGVEGESLSSEETDQSELHADMRADFGLLPGAVSPEEIAHGNIGQDAHNADPLSEIPIGASDPEHLAHGNDGGHEHVQENGEEDAKPVGVADPESLVHGDTDEVHSDEQDVVTEDPIGVVDPEHIIHGEENHGAHDKLRDGDKVIGAVDPEHLVHGDSGDATHEEVPFMSNSDGQKPVAADEEFIHRMMHGDKPHTHDQPAEKISMEDLKKLNLPQDILDSKDILKIVKGMQDDYKEWATSDENYVQEFNMNDNMMEMMAEKYHLKDKARPLNVPKSDEWEDTDDQKDTGLAENEDSIQHRLEMMGNSAPIKHIHRNQKELFVDKQRHIHDDP